MDDYGRIEKVIRQVATHHREQSGLATLARVAGLSPRRLDRLFKAWAGTTAKDFVQHLTVLETRRLLRTGGDVWGTSFERGFSGSRRLHDLCVCLEVASGGEIRSGGAGWVIHWGGGETPFGKAWLAWTLRGIVRLAFVDEVGVEERELRESLRRDWPCAAFEEDQRQARRWLRLIFRPGGLTLSIAQKPMRWQVLVRGTAFQQRVWRALVALPAGSVETYCGLARRVGVPRGARAVGSAVGSNPVAFLIPCHRVIQASGACGNYRWGSERKKAMLVWEKIQM